MSDELRAKNDIVGNHIRHNGFRGAYRRGYQAALEGKPKIPPYDDLRGGENGHIVTWSRAYMRYWEEGYDAALRAPGGGERA